MECWWDDNEGGGDKSLPVSLGPPNIPHWLAMDFTGPFAMTGQWLTAWAMVTLEAYIYKHEI